MPNKGSPCGCPKCHVHVNCEAGGSGGVSGNALNCCKCAPKRLCVEVWFPAGTGTVGCILAPPEDDPDGPITRKTFLLDCDFNQWAGTVLLDETVVDLAFYFERDAEDVCWFYLESIALGYVGSSTGTGTGTGDTRLKILLPGTSTGTGTARSDYCLNPDFEFDVDLGSVVSGCNVVIATAAADYQEISIANRKRCTTSGTGTGTGSGTGTGTGTAGDCQDGLDCLDCYCWCRCVCISYQDDVTYSNTKVCWDTVTETWELAITGGTLSIGFYCDPLTGESKLALSDPWSPTTNLIPAQCPDAEGTWSIEKTDGTPVSVGISCATCGRCLQSDGESEPCGCTTVISKLLYATFSPGVSPGPPEPYPKSCTGATGSFPIVYDTVTGTWTGWGRPFSGCDTLIYLRMTCMGSNLMKLEMGESLMTLSDLGTVAVTCDPFTGEWVGVTLLVATDVCCGTTGDPGTADYNIYDITITE